MNQTEWLKEILFLKHSQIHWWRLCVHFLFSWEIHNILQYKMHNMLMAVTKHAGFAIESCSLNCWQKGQVQKCHMHQHIYIHCIHNKWRNTWTSNSKQDHNDWRWYNSFGQTNSCVKQLRSVTQHVSTSSSTTSLYSKTFHSSSINPIHFTFNLRKWCLNWHITTHHSPCELSADSFHRKKAKKEFVEHFWFSVLLEQAT